MNRHVQAVAGSVAAVAVATGAIYALKPIAPVLSLGVVFEPHVILSSVPYQLFR